MQNAVLNTIKRSLIENEACGCTPQPGYFVDKTAFWCQEDYYISPSLFLKSLKQKGYKWNGTDSAILIYLEKTQKLLH